MVKRVLILSVVLSNVLLVCGNSLAGPSDLQSF